MAVTLGGTSLPDYSTYELESRVPGVSIELANGDMHHDNLANDIRETLTIGWKAVSQGTKNNLVSEYNDLLQNGAQSFTDINGDSYTVNVIRDSLRIKQVIRVGSNAIYDISIKLQEVI